MSRPQIFDTTIHAEIEQIVREHLAAFARGDFEAWGSQLAPNAFFTAADPDEVFSEREGAIAEMHKDFDPAFDEGLQLDIQPEASHIGVSTGGNVAWVATPLRYTVNFAGEVSSFLIRHTELLKKSDSLWSIVATQYSLTLPESKVLQHLASGRLPAPRTIGDRVQPGAESLVEEFTYQLNDLTSAAISTDAHIFGPLPGEDANRETAVRQLIGAWTSRWGSLRLRPDGVRAEFTSENVGWVAANVEVTMRSSDQEVALPLRALVVYQKEQGIWKIVHAHISVGIPDHFAE